MAQFSRLEVLNAMIDDGLVPVFYNGDIEQAVRIVKACAAGGVTCVEFTNRGDFAPEVFSDLAKHCQSQLPDVIPGVGSVGDAPTAATYLNAGANFVVGPILNERVAKICNRRMVPYSPGCGSATEISRAQELGVEICKIFPASVPGPTFCKSIKGPMPWTRIMPTGGVDISQETVNSWIKAGADALGIGSSLVRKDLVARGDFDKITEEVRNVLHYIEVARQ